MLVSLLSSGHALRTANRIEAKRCEAESSNNELAKQSRHMPAGSAHSCWLRCSAQVTPYSESKRNVVKLNLLIMSLAKQEVMAMQVTELQAVMTAKIADAVLAGCRLNLSSKMAVET